MTPIRQLGPLFLKIFKVKTLDKNVDNLTPFNVLVFGLF